ncbi:hypothetical protein LCGC14_1649700 [marine sediment metagenome]|uniref:Xylose isomerase-like TIM barrel domain-containing protein n=1 Tax=marine sediment metagenome TaxID=412755 RepID=A0A0F9KD35_9ZZZZ
MKIALDPFMHRHLSLEAPPSKVAELGYEWIELSPRGDFLEWFKAPRVFPDRIRSFKTALRDANVGIASLLPMYRWASNDEEERRAAVRHWKRAVEIAGEHDRTASTLSALAVWGPWLRRAQLGSLRWLADGVLLSAGDANVRASVRSQLSGAGLLVDSALWGDAAAAVCWSLLPWARAEIARRGK